jgi:hypothetical protein
MGNNLVAGQQVQGHPAFQVSRNSPPPIAIPINYFFPTPRHKLPFSINYFSPHSATAT